MNVLLVSLMLGWMITKISCEDSSTIKPPLPVKNFRCDNGNYIDNSYFCDDDLRDCTNGDISDESFGCNKGECGNGRFKCHSDGPCIDITSRCNTIPDCADKSDELNCGEETHIENCTLSGGKYLCKDKLKCIDFKYACNLECNCLDCSDETDHCPKFDKHSCSACPQFCLPTPQGPQCVCNSTNYETSKLCREIENCTGSSNCDQHCSRYNDVERCLCYDDHHEIYDYNGKVHCRNNVWLKFMVLISTATKIRLGSFSFSNNTFYNWEWLFNSTQNEVLNCTALSAAKDQLFYATNFRGKERIFKTEFNTGSTEKLIELDSSIKSMAVDWITSNLYFTSNESLSVCSNDGRICTRIKCCYVDFVTLASKFGCMFYTNGIAAEGERFVMRSNMDGSEEQVFLDMSFHYPVSLAADEWTERIYWFEVETQLLHSITLWGKDLRQYDLSEMKFSTHFSILERRAFFIRSHDNIYTSESHKNFTHFQPLPSSNTNLIRNVYAYNRILQNTNEIRNPCRTIPCHGLCLLRSETSSSAGLNYSCMCENFVPKRDNRWCKNHPVESDLKFTTSTTSEARADTSTRMYSTSTKKPDPEKSTEGLTVLSSATQSCDSEWYFSLGLGIMFYMAVVMSIFTFLSCFFIYKNFHSKRRYNVGFCDEIEL